MNNYFKNKSFVLTTVLLMLLSVLLIAVPPFIPGLLGGNDGAGTASARERGADEEELEDLQSLGLVNMAWNEDEAEALQTKMPAEWKTYASPEDLSLPEKIRQNMWY